MPQWWIILIVDPSVDKRKRAMEGENQDKPSFSAVCPTSQRSAQDNKSCECIFNTESMYTAVWRLTCFFSAQICYSNVARLLRQPLSIHSTSAYFTVCLWVIGKEIKQYLTLNRKGLHLYSVKLCVVITKMSKERGSALQGRQHRLTSDLFNTSGASL